LFSTHSFIFCLQQVGVAGFDSLKVRAKIKKNEAVKGDLKLESSNLYNLLITPIADQLKDKKAICIIPNGKLSNVPFQALGQYNADSSFRVLVEDYRIFYTNKMDIFKNEVSKNHIEESFIAFGNPDKSLPNATKEVQNLKSIFSNAVVFTEELATENKAKSSLADYRFVHFATHGVLNCNAFDSSFLVFNADKDDPESDGMLTIRKINGLTMDCDLVALSACEMAVSGETVKGWYVSPANSFLVNNVRSVIASMWQVDDEATSILLTNLYRIIKNKMPLAEALRQAQAALSRNPKYTHPYFWSAFVLYGDWR